MNELVQIALNYVRMVWRFRWLSLVVAGLACAGGWLAVAMLPDEFEVKAKVYLDTRSMLRPVLKGLAVNSNSQADTAQMVRRTLLARPNLETVARKTDMDLQAKTPEDFNRLLTSLATSIKVGGTNRDNIYVIGFNHSDRELAARVVESVLNLFVERSLGESRKDSSVTRQFVERQIAEYEARLDGAETRLKEFKQRNVGLMPGDGKNYYEQLGEARSRLAGAELQLREATRRQDALERQIEGEEPTFGLAEPSPVPVARHSAAVVTPFDARQRELESRLDGLLVQYTEKHPDVRYTRGLLEEVTAQRDEWIEENPPPPPVAPTQVSGGFDLNENPVYQSLRVSLGSAQADVAALTARVEEYAQRASRLEELVDTVPRVEAELKKLNRDYSINKRNYEELVKRRESLKLSEDADQTGDNVQFKIIEPPRVPLVPIGPDRPMMSAMALMGGLGAGVGLALLLGLLRPAIYTRDDFPAITGLPVLGVVSRIWTPRERLRRRLEVASFATAGLALLGIFVGLEVLYASGVNIPDGVRSMADRVVDKVQAFL